MKWLFFSGEEASGCQSTSQTAFTMNVLLQMHRVTWSVQKRTESKNKTDRFSVVHPLMCGTGDLWGTDAVFLLDFRGPTCQDRETMKDFRGCYLCQWQIFLSLLSKWPFFLLLLHMINFISFQGSVTKLKIIVIIMM